MQENHLCFYVKEVEGALEIKSYGKFGMDYALKPDEFENKDMLNILPLSEQDRQNVALAFAQAGADNKITAVEYTLYQTQYTATITPLTSSSDINYVVKVTENK